MIVDVQYDFCEGGSLGVTGSPLIFPVINQLKKNDFFSHVICTKDWHPPGHVSFASTHGKEPFTAIELPTGKQELWPDHCLQGTHGAELSKDLELDGKEVIIHKGFDKNRDSYSGFFEGEKGVELREKLKELQVLEVFVCGLAFDYCVGSTALDAHKFGFKTCIIRDGTKSVAKDSEVAMHKRLADNKITIVTAAEVLAQ